jgi:hypothetical protein
VRVLRVLWLGVLGCGGAPVAADPPTWHRDVRPIVERSCVPCHADGGIAPFSLEADAVDLDAGVPAWAELAVRAVEARTMPPWAASPACHRIARSERLEDDEVELFTAWRDGGFPAGDPADFVPIDVAPVVDPGPPDLRLDPGVDYTPSDALADDYRCFPVGDVFEQDTMIRAIDVRPTQRAIVHHAVAFLVPAEGVAAVEAADAAGEGPGYGCFGGPVPGNAVPVEHLHAWVPGAFPEVLPDGDARRLAAGSRVVLQMHYNLATLPPGTPPPADRTEVALWRHDGDPLATVTTLGLLDTDIPIPAGDPEVVHTKTFRLRTPELVVGVAGHMHQLGRALSLDVVHRDGDRDCLLDLPTWDFGFQRTYAYPTTRPAVLAPEDALQVSCTFDNSAANQPIVDGERLEPRDRHFGEGSLDEMCLAYVLVRRGWTIEGDTRCAPFEACFDRCPRGDGACLMTCASQAVTSCTDCALDGLVACGASACGDELDALTTCLDRCGVLGGPHACLVGPCRPKAAAYLGCLDPQVRAGRCDDALATCGIAFGSGR